MPTYTQDRILRRKAFDGIQLSAKQMQQIQRIQEYQNNTGDSSIFRFQVVLIQNNVHTQFVERYRRSKAIHPQLTLKRMLCKYGKENGLMRWKEYCDKQQKTNSFEYKRDKYGYTKEDFESFNKSRQITLETLSKKYGEEEGKTRWEQYRERQRYTCTLEYYEDLYKDPTLAKQKFDETNRKKSNTLENYISRYGNIDGPKLFKKYCEIAPSGYSKISQKLFWMLDEEFGLPSYFAEKNREFGKMSPTGYVKYDYTIPSLKLCVEFHGDHWHQNPKIYRPNDIPRMRGNKKKARELWQKDKEKTQLLEQEGFTIVVVWESEFKDDPRAVVNRIKEYVNDRISQ